MTAGKRAGRPRSTGRPLTGLQTAKVITQVARLFSQPGVSNPRVAEALEAAAAVVAAAGTKPVTSLLRLQERLPEAAQPAEPLWVRELTTDEVRRRIEDPQTSKKELIDIAQVRFGIPRARLAKLGYDEAADAVLSAAANEDSLEIIAVNADESGRQRRA
jgi:hypothetical protein